jgi:hypothetical protein
MVVLLPRALAVLPLQRIKFGQVGQRKTSVGCAMVIAGQWSVLAVARRSSQHGSNKQNQYDHGVEDQWPWPGRSLDMVEPTPIHGLLVLLV